MCACCSARALGAAPPGSCLNLKLLHEVQGLGFLYSTCDCPGGWDAGGCGGGWDMAGSERRLGGQCLLIESLRCGIVFVTCTGKDLEKGK